MEIHRRDWNKKNKNKKRTKKTELAQCVELTACSTCIKLSFSLQPKDYPFAKKLRSTLSSHSKYERVKCNTDKLPNITALNMTVTRLPANLASRTHNFSLRGIMCPWLSPITVSISSNQKSDFAEHTFFEEKKIQLSLAYIYLSLRRRLMRRY